MQKQIASFNTFVSRQTLPISSCDGLCTDQNDTAASVHLRDDIAVVCSKLSQTSHLKYRKRSGLRERQAIRKRTAFALNHLPTSFECVRCIEIHRSNFCMTALLFNTTVRANHQVARSQHHAEITQQFFCSSKWDLGSNAQQHIKSALHAVILSG